MAVQSQAVIVAVMGASGSGKSAYIKQQIRRGKPKRLIVFDPMGEYFDLAAPVSTIQAVASAAKHKAFSLSFKPDSGHAVEQFDLLCRIAYAAGECWLVAEELSIVTRPGSAPPGWADCSMRGRHKGMTVIGASQRPASIDKNFFSNATMIRTGRLNFATDIKTLANVLHVDNAEISLLKPLEFIQRDTQTGEIQRGKLHF